MKFSYLMTQSTNLLSNILTNMKKKNLSMLVKVISNCQKMMTFPEENSRKSRKFSNLSLIGGENYAPTQLTPLSSHKDWLTILSSLFHQNLAIQLIWKESVELKLIHHNLQVPTLIQRKLLKSIPIIQLSKNCLKELRMILILKLKNSLKFFMKLP